MVITYKDIPTTAEQPVKDVFVDGNYLGYFYIGEHANGWCFYTDDDEEIVEVQITAAVLKELGNLLDKLNKEDPPMK